MALPDLRVREVTAAEAVTVVGLLHAAFAEYHGRLDPPSGAHAETVEKVRERMAGARVALAEWQGSAGGCVFYEPRGDFLYLFRLAVVPAHRCRGVGRKLVEYVEAQARAQRRTGVQLGVRLALPRLQAYYERQGYRVIDHGTHAGYDGPTYVTMLKEVRSLQDARPRGANKA